MGLRTRSPTRVIMGLRTTDKITHAGDHGTTDNDHPRRVMIVRHASYVARRLWKLWARVSTNVEILHQWRPSVLTNISSGEWGSAANRMSAFYEKEREPALTCSMLIHWCSLRVDPHRFGR